MSALIPQPSPTQLLRDLCWVVNSPSLIETHSEVEVHSSRNSIRADEVDVDHLAAFFDGKVSRRVGHYFERHVLYWLAHIERFESVRHSIQVRSGKTTLGEIDFLYYDRSNRLTHLEVAVKFYLFHQPIAINGSHFIGPNLRDTFELKQRRLFEHQLSVSEDSFPEIEVRKAMVKGRVFYPIDEDVVQEPGSGQLPEGMAPGHLHARWIRLTEFLNLPSNSRSRYRRLIKPFWLSNEVVSDADFVGEEVRVVKQQVTELIDQEQTPVLLSKLQPESENMEQRPANWIEHARFFVVPDGWPSCADTLGK